MMKTIRRTQAALCAVTLAGALLSLPQVSWAAGRSSGATAMPQDAGAASSSAAAKLNKKQFRNVQVTVENGIATLTGTVDLYEY
jgi:hypothetical protein